MSGVTCGGSDGIRRSALVASGSLGLLGAVLWFADRSGAGRPAPADGTATSADLLLRRFNDDRMELHALVTILVLEPAMADPLPVGVPVHGQVSWHADLGRVRTDADFPEHLAPGYSGSVGWTADQGAWAASVASGVLAIAAHAAEPDRMAMQQTNPLTLLVQHCRPWDDGNVGDVILWSDLGQVEPPPEEPVWTADFMGGDEVEVAEYPGGWIDGSPYTFRLTVPLGERDRPLRIEALDASGALLLRTSFGYPDAVGWRWPTAVQWELFDGQAAPLVVVDFSIELLALGAEAQSPPDGFNPPMHAWPVVVDVEATPHP